MSSRALLVFGLCALCFPSMAAVMPPTLRLPSNVQPVRYAADLRLTPGDDRFEGRIEIEIEIRERTPVIWLHAKALEFGRASIRVGGAERIVRLAPAPNDLIALTDDAGFPAGRAELHIDYTGSVSRKLTDGAFAQREGNDWYIFTKFEPVTARRVFPCFDEPSFKVPWQLTLHIPSGLRAFSNTPEASEASEPGGRVVRFAETKPLPSYLVAFAVGPFDIVETKPVGRRHVPSRIIVPRGRELEAGYAASVTPELINLLETYFGTPYPYEKLDQIVVPITTSWGAMENAGLIAYGQFLLNPKDTDTEFRRQRCAGTMLHEMSHQWFGDLVTMAWWDDIWLNESFASWLAAKLSEEWKPEWQTGLSAAANTNVMAADSLISARAIRQPILAPGDIGAAFDAITYGKGSAVIAMFERYAGAERFRNAVQLYLKRHAWKSATASDLLQALDTVAGEENGRAFATFLNQGGFPLIHADVRCGEGTPVLRLGQRRFLPLGSRGTEDAVWNVPIGIKWARSGAVREKRVLLSKAEQEFPLGDAPGCPDWIFLDAGAPGYYAAVYGGDWEARLFDGGFPSLKPVERVAAVRNLEVLFAAGKAKVPDTLRAAVRLSRENEPEIVRQSAALLGGIYDMVPAALEGRYLALMRARFEQRARELGWKPAPGDSQSTRRLRNELVLWMATRGQDAVLQAQAARLAGQWFAAPDSLDPDSVSPVLQAAAWTGGRPFYSRLITAIRASNVQRERQWMIRAIPSFRDVSLTRGALDLLFEPGIEPRELQTILFNAKDGAREIVWEFVKANFDRLNSTLPGARGIPFGATLPRAAANFCDAGKASEVEAFFTPRLANLSGGRRNLENALEKIRLCAAQTEAMRPEIAAFLR